MKRKTTVVAAAAAVVLALLAGQAALAAGGGGGERGYSWHRGPGAAGAAAPAAGPAIDREIRLVERAGDFAFVDVGEPDESPGDYFLVRDPLFDATNTSRVGTLVVQCTLNVGPVVLCEGTVTLRNRGKITFFGTDQATTTQQDFPLTGGQGEFRAVRGEAHVVFGEETSQITLRLVD